MFVVKSLNHGVFYFSVYCMDVIIITFLLQCVVYECVVYDHNYFLSFSFIVYCVNVFFMFSFFSFIVDVLFMIVIIFIYSLYCVLYECVVYNYYFFTGAVRTSQRPRKDKDT